jgi:hypothetical protein
LLHLLRRHPIVFNGVHKFFVPPLKLFRRSQ